MAHNGPRPLPILVYRFIKKGKRAREIRQIAWKGRLLYLQLHAQDYALAEGGKNQIFKAIESVSLNPNEFEFKNSDTEALLKHKWSDSYFVIGGNAGHYVGRHVVGDAFDRPYEEYSWQSLMWRFSRWVKEVKDDLDTPDLWAELQRDARLLGRITGETHGNTPFTSEEKKEIERRLREVEAHVRNTYSLTEPEMEALHRKIDSLIDAAGRLNRIDWLNACAGALFGFILSVGLPVESVRPFMTDLLHHLFEHGLPQLPIGG